MAPFQCWAELPTDILCRVGDRLDLKWYTSARGVCTAWRCALAPPSPSLLLFFDVASWCPYAASLPARRSFELTSIISGTRCVGSSNGWLALSVELFGGPVFVLLDPITAVEIVLPPLIYERTWVSKIVFTPSPTKEDFAAAAICDIDRIAYVTAGARRWAIMDPIRLTRGDQFTNVLYIDTGKVYCLTSCGDVYLLRLPERRRRQPANADEAGPSEPEFSVLQKQPPDCTVSFRAMRWNQQLGMVCCEQEGHDPNIPVRFTFCTDTCIPYNSPPPGSQWPHLNAPATVEPLLSEANLPFVPTAVFAPPYDSVSAFTSAKNLVFCEGNLYQVWRNASCTVTIQLPGGGQRRVAENEIFILRYYPRRQPCWDVVNDLGGYSFFVGRNNAVSMYADGIPELRGNCVYWIGCRGRDQGMVFDMQTGRSAPCRAPRVWFLTGLPRSTICWYFLSDVVSNTSNNLADLMQDFVE